MGTQPRARVHAGRNLEIDFRGPFLASGAVADPAGFVHHPPGALAFWASLRDAENAAGHQHLAATAAGLTGAQPRILFAARAVAVPAQVQFGQRNLLLTPMRGLLE